jgi:hypothetical protein
MAKDSYARPQKSTKAELHEMLAEAVRNTQPQPGPVRDAQSEPVREARPAPKHKTRPAPKHKTRPAPKRTAKTKRARG